jgi:hypothetical protein
MRRALAHAEPEPCQAVDQVEVQAGHLLAGRGRWRVAHAVDLVQVVHGPGGQGSAERIRRLDRDQAVVGPIAVRKSQVQPLERP